MPNFIRKLVRNKHKERLKNNHDKTAMSKLTYTCLSGLKKNLKYSHWSDYIYV